MIAKVASIILTALIIILGICLLFWLGSAWFGGMETGIKNWWESITDPTERGCAYIATSIAAHAFVLMCKSMGKESE